MGVQMSSRDDNRHEFKCVFIGKTAGITQRLYEKVIEGGERMGEKKSALANSEQNMTKLGS